MGALIQTQTVYVAPCNNHLCWKWEGLIVINSSIKIDGAFGILESNICSCILMQMLWITITLKKFQSPLEGNAHISQFGDGLQAWSRLKSMLPVTFEQDKWRLLFQLIPPPDSRQLGWRHRPENRDSRSPNNPERGYRWCGGSYKTSDPNLWWVNQSTLGGGWIT